MYKYRIPSRVTTVIAWPVLPTILPVPLAWSGETQWQRFENQRTGAVWSVPGLLSGSTDCALRRVRSDDRADRILVSGAFHEKDQRRYRMGNKSHELDTSGRAAVH